MDRESHGLRPKPTLSIIGINPLSAPDKIPVAPSSRFYAPTMLYNPNQILFGEAHPYAILLGSTFRWYLTHGARHIPVTAQTRPEHVILWVVDGISDKAPDRVDLPNLKALATQGVYYRQNYTVQTADPLTSLASGVNTTRRRSRIPCC